MRKATSPDLTPMPTTVLMSGAPRSRLLNLLAAAMFFLGGSGASLWMAHRLSEETLKDARTRFETQVDQLEQAVIDKFDNPLQALKGVTALQSLDRGLSRKQFRDYWAARGFQHDFPGVHGFGYIAHVAPQQLEAFLASERRDHGADFRVRTLGPTHERYIIKLIEPIEKNRSAIGLDIGSERVRRTAADAAMRSGLPTLSGVITLVQDGRQGPGFLLLVPTYRTGADLRNEAQRRAAHIGFAYSPLVAEDHFRPLLFNTLGQMHFDIEVRTPHDPPQWVFKSETPIRETPAAADQPAAPPPLFAASRHFLVAGLEFALLARSSKAFEATVDTAKGRQIGIGGIALSGAMAFVLWLLVTGRARAEARAQELSSEMRRLAVVAERTSNSVIIADAEHRIVWVNHAFTALSGQTLEEVRGRRASDFRGDVQDPQTLATIRAALQNGANLRIETVNQSSDGRTFWVDLDLQTLRDTEGRYQGYVAVERDITASKLALEREHANAEQLAAALRETDALMNTINAHAIVSEAGRDGLILRANDAFCRISGYSQEELIGQDHRIVNSGTHDKTFWQEMWRCLGSGTPWRGQICNRAKDGSLYWVDSIISPFMDASGRIQKYVSIRFDITQAYEVEQELARERQRLTNTLEGTNVGTWEVNVLTGENRIDTRWASMLGYRLEELLPITPEKWQALVHPDDEKAADARLMDYLHGRADIYEIERRLKHKDGHWVWVLSRGIVSKRLPDGRVEWMSGTHMDITDRHRLQEDAQQRSELMSTIIENLPGGLSTFDADLNLILRNSKFGELLQLPETLLTRNPTTFEDIIRFNALRGEYGPGNPEDAVAAIVERARHPVAHAMERTRPDGSTLEVRGLPLPGGGFVSTYTDITERKRLEQALRASEEMLERAGQVAGIGSWSVDLRKNRVHWSQQTRHIHEVPTDFVPTVDNAIAFYAPDSRDEMVRLVEQAVREGKGFDAELRLITATGREIWVRSVGEAEFVGGAAVRLIGAFQDVTERRVLEQRVRAQNQLLTATLENMPGGLVAFDANLTLVMRNRQFGTLLNFPESIFEQQPLRYESLVRNEAERGEFGAGDVEEIVAKAMKSARENKEKIFERIRPNGQILEVRVQPMGDGGVLFMLIDITQRKIAERKARHADEMLREAIETLDEAFVIFNDQDRLLICNQRYRDIYPVAAAVMNPGTTFEEIIRYGAERGEYAQAVGRVDEWVSERLRQHQSADSDVVQELGDGRYLRIVERKTDSGFIVGFRIDITDLVSARLAAEEGSKSKSQFLANMSHEIRTPMNAILGMLSLLQNTELSVRQLDYVNKTEGAARSLLGLLNDILDFSKVEAGKMALESVPFSIDLMMRDLSVILSANTGSKNLELLFDIDPRLPARVVGDSLRLKQVLINLGGNAIKFTEAGTVVLQIAVLECQAGKATLEFSVRDTGIGIAPDNLQRIFEGFSQAEASTTRRFGGTGLGLAISSRLVDLMGGELRVESKLGKGSRFYFCITMDVEVTSAPTMAPALQTDTSRLQVLVIDDNPLALQVLQGMMQSIGWLPDLASTGEDGLRLIHQRAAQGKNPYDAIFVDWQMPGMDGWETSRQIRQLQSGHLSPILVMVTAHGREMLAQRPADEQAVLNGFLVKPVTPSMVLDAIREARHARHGQAPAAAQTRTVQRLKGMRVLVVEDNAINQQVAKELLEREGALVTLASDGQQGVLAVTTARQPWHVVLMDVQMPVMDGYTATRMIRQEPGLARLAIIAMTANAMESDRQDALAAGMNAHVGKPFSLDELVAAMLRESGYQPQADLTPVDAGTAMPSIAAPALPASTAEFDLQSSLEIMGGDVDMLARILQSFARELPGQPLELTTLLAQGKGIEARRLMHTLKGMAATVGAHRLSAIAGEAEKRLIEEPEPTGEDAAHLLAILQPAVDAACNDLVLILGQLRPLAAANLTPGTELDRTALQTDLQKLIALLRNSDLASLDALAHLRERHGSALQDELNDLEEAMAGLDFGKAHQLCEALSQRYTA